MLRFGLLCRGCGWDPDQRQRVCRDLPLDERGHGIECPVCMGDGCNDCDQGRFFQPGCPQQAVTQASLTAIRLADFCELGHLPHAGGLLDQPQAFLETARFVMNEKERFKEELLNDGRQR